MGEPVDERLDWLETRGGKEQVSYRAYVPSTDSHATAVTCWGMRSAKTVQSSGVGDGAVSVITSTWTLCDLTSRPVVRGLVVDGSETWVIDSVEIGPHEDVYVVGVTLG